MSSEVKHLNIDNMTPKEIVAELDKYIIGQNKAKKMVAIALRNRMRRQLLNEDLRDEVAPKNIIMIGPTGVGKTEIARRLSKLTGAPFIKVEATKYTEVGYVGRDVESMVRDLMNSAIGMVKAEMQENVKEEAERRTEEALLDLLLPPENKKKDPTPAGFAAPEETAPAADVSSTREKFRKMLKDGKFEDKEVEIETSKGGMPAIEIFSGTNMEEIEMQLGGLSSMFGGGRGKKRRKMKISQARNIIMGQEMDKLIDQDRVIEIAKERTEQSGIIFIDEIDKIATGQTRQGGDVSREGVQRDILPIVEGSKVNSKYGMIDTSHVLFIAAGAFHISKPSDLIPELQGRFPLRVELEALEAEDFYKILSEPKNALIKQYVALLETEGVELEFKDEAIKRLSQLAADVNSKTENIGARRLHTIMELLVEEISFNAPDLKGQEIPITKEYVDERLASIAQDRDLSQYIL